MTDSADHNLGLRFQRVAAEHAGETALWFDVERQIGYAELDRLSNLLAHRLLGRGVGPRDVVCLSGDKSEATFATILACLKIGAVYSVLDPEGPTERQRSIISTCRPRLVIGNDAFLERAGFAATDPRVMTLEQDPAALLGTAGSVETEPSEMRGVTGSDPAYIMFTSGSTGVPKGAVMTHDNVRNLIDWARRTYTITDDDVLTNVNPLYFDNSVFDLYAALFNGATLVPFTRQEVRDPKALVDKVAAAGCTLWFSVPSLLIFLQTVRAADGVNLRSIRRFVFGGEGYPKAKLQKLYQAYAPTSELHNVYGPTECTCICSSHRLTDDDFRDLQALPSLGRIADNFSYLLRGEDGRPVTGDEVGELCLLGPGVGLGYYNDPERTAASFIQNPTNTSYREIMYTTGDLVRLEPATGHLSILGRRDHQVKHMGYRIELGEIEAALNRLEYVSEAAALHGSHNGLSRIVAVIASDRDVDRSTIRRDLAGLIPEYMIPSAFHREAMLPKNANGKVDRLRLAATYLPPEST
jgi:D-alanine--poly(phosphoribitol) ligase subunit 1